VRWPALKWCTHLRLMAAQGLVFGSPFRAEIERRDPSALDCAAEAVAQALVRWDGKDAPMSAHLITARSSVAT
jgi:hypothetical protein